MSDPRPPDDPRFDNPLLDPKENLFSMIAEKIYHEQEQLEEKLRRTKNVAYSGIPEIEVNADKDGVIYSIRGDVTSDVDYNNTSFVAYTGRNSSMADHFELDSPFVFRFSKHIEAETEEKVKELAAIDGGIHFAIETDFVVGKDKEGKYKMVKAVALPKAITDKSRVRIAGDYKSEKMDLVESRVEPSDYELVGNTTNRFRARLNEFHQKTEGMYLKPV